MWACREWQGGMLDAGIKYIPPLSWSELTCQDNLLCQGIQNITVAWYLPKFVYAMLATQCHRMCICQYFSAATTFGLVYISISLARMKLISDISTMIDQLWVKILISMSGKPQHRDNFALALISLISPSQPCYHDTYRYGSRNAYPNFRETVEEHAALIMRLLWVTWFYICMRHG